MSWRLEAHSRQATQDQIANMDPWTEKVMSWVMRVPEDAHWMALAVSWSLQCGRCPISQTNPYEHLEALTVSHHVSMSCGAKCRIPAQRRLRCTSPIDVDARIMWREHWSNHGFTTTVVIRDHPILMLEHRKFWKPPTSYSLVIKHGWEIPHLYILSWHHSFTHLHGFSLPTLLCKPDLFLQTLCWPIQQ